MGAMKKVRLYRDISYGLVNREIVIFQKGGKFACGNHYLVFSETNIL